MSCAGLLAGCSSGDYGPAASAPPPPAPVKAAAAPAADATISGAPITAADGYPNINVDTARPLRTPTRTADERRRLEAELMALAARQNSSVDASKPASVIEELQELGRRSKADAERQIESGAAPIEP